MRTEVEPCLLDRAITSLPSHGLGVGKTSLVHVICHKEALSNPGWTVGCSVEVKVRLEPL